MPPPEPSLAELARRALTCMDRRSMGLARIGLALLLLVDLGWRVSTFGTWLADDGLLPTAMVRSLARPMHLASLLLLSPGDGATAAFLALAAVVYLALLVGYRTLIAQVAALVVIVSLVNRVPTTLNGGDRMLCILCFWTAFLPMGDRFSLDARRAGPRRDPEPFSSVAVFGVLAQLAVIYLCTSLLKGSQVWRDGSALGYFLRDVTLTSSVGCAVGEHAPPWLLALLTRASKLVEYVAPFLILSPIYTTWTRRAAIVLLGALHLGIAVTLNVGLFSYAMLAFFPLLLGEDDWILIERIGRRLRPERAAEAAPPAPDEVAPAPRRATTVAREVVAGIFVLLCAHRVLAENGGGLDLTATPKAIRAIVEYPRLAQGWGMFVEDHRWARTMIVDAETADGRHVDPLHEAAGPGNGPFPWKRMPACANEPSPFQKFFIGLEHNRVTRQSLDAWLARYAQRTGRDGDRIVRYTVFEAVEALPPPGEPRSGELELTRRFEGAFDQNAYAK